MKLFFDESIDMIMPPNTLKNTTTHTADSPVLQSHQLLTGTTWHARHLPNKHHFNYPYRYWGVSLNRLVKADYPTVDPLKFNALKWLGLHKLGLHWFSCTDKKAIHALVFSDYSTKQEHDQNSDQPTTAQDWLTNIQTQFIEKTNSQPTGDILAVVVTRNLGKYFSPVNFYVGYDQQGKATHLLAEVSNTPWNKCHFYGFLLTGQETKFSHAKDFHVSPFNPIDQQYHWHVKITPKSLKNSTESDEKTVLNDIFINISVTDSRGEVFNAGVKLDAQPMHDTNIIHSIKQNPVMNYSSMLRIYWQAMRLYLAKRVPYIAYNQKLKDSKQR